MASLSGNKIKDTYQSLIKFSDNSNITTGAKVLTDGFGNSSPLYVSTTQIGIGVTPTVQFHASGDGKFGGNLTVIGNLVVEGSTTTVGTDTLTVKDPLIVLANNNTSSDAVDIGFYGKYTPSSTTLYSGIFRDAGDDKFKLFKSLQVEPTTVVDTGGTGYAAADLVIGNLQTNGLLEESTQFKLTKDIRIFDAIPAITLQDSDEAGSGADGSISWLDSAASQRAVINLSTNDLGITSKHGAITFGTNSTPAASIDVSQNTSFLGNVSLANNKKIQFGGSQELEIYYDGNNNSYIQTSTSGEGDLTIRTQDATGSGYNLYLNSTNDIFMLVNTNENGISVLGEGAVKLYYANVEKLATTNTGVNITGTLGVSSTLTAADISTGNISAGNGIFSGGITANGTSVTNTFKSTVLINRVGQVSSLLIGSNSVDDVLIGFQTDGNSMAMGIDRSDGNAFKISDAVGLGTNDRFKIDTSGNSTFTGDLTMSSGAINSKNLLFSGATIPAANTPSINLRDSNNEFYFQSGSAHVFNFIRYDNRNSMMNIESTGINVTGGGTFAGNVGVGGSPVLKLEVQGTASSPTPFGSAAINGVVRIAAGGTNPILDIGSNSAAPYEMWLQAHVPSNTYGTPISLNPLGGNVGIGTRSPSTKLDVVGSTTNGSGVVDTLKVKNEGTTANDGPRIQFTSGTSTSGAAIGSQGKALNSADLLFYAGGNTERMRIDRSGNISIGTVNIVSKLTIGGIGSTANFNDGANNLRLETSSTPAASPNVAGAGVTFAQKYWSGSASLARVGAIYGVKDAANGAYGGGLGFYTQPSGVTTDMVQRMRIDSSGNVGIGTTSPQRPLHINGTEGAARFTSTASGNNGFEVGIGTASQAFLWQTENSYMHFATNGVERMRITSGGDVLINATATVGAARIMLEIGSGENGYTTKPKTNISYAPAVFRASSGTTIGVISCTTTATSYNTSSDYRLKENVVEMTGALDRVNQLKPSRFNFIADKDRTVDGFLAHEVQEIVPEAITGEKDAMQDEEYEKTPAVYKDVKHPAKKAVYKTIKHSAVKEELDDDGKIIVEAKKAYTEKILVTEAVKKWTESVLVSEAVKDTRQVPNYQGIDQSKIVPLLVGAIQELKAEIDLLKGKCKCK